KGGGDEEGGKVLALVPPQPGGDRPGGGRSSGPGRGHHGELLEIPRRGEAETDCATAAGPRRGRRKGSEGATGDRAAGTGPCRGRGEESAAGAEPRRPGGRGHAAEPLLRADAPAPAGVARTPR